MLVCLQFCWKKGTLYWRFDKASTPGKTLPSSSSKLAPPPVETCDTLSSVSHLAQQVAVSPPPMMVVAPALVAATTSSMIALVPLANFSNSNTPTGPFHTISLALRTASLNTLTDSGPQSKPYFFKIFKWAEICDALLFGFNLPSIRLEFRSRRWPSLWWHPRRTCQLWQSPSASGFERCWPSPSPRCGWQSWHPLRRTMIFRSFQILGNNLNYILYSLFNCSIKTSESTSFKRTFGRLLMSSTVI